LTGFCLGVGLWHCGIRNSGAGTECRGDAQQPESHGTTRIRSRRPRGRASFQQPDYLTRRLRRRPRRYARWIPRTGWLRRPPWRSTRRWRQAGLCCQRLYPQISCVSHSESAVLTFALATLQRRLARSEGSLPSGCTYWIRSPCRCPHGP
jgi:hypothetical protein